MTAQIKFDRLINRLTYQFNRLFIIKTEKKEDGKNVATTDAARTSQVGMGFAFSLHQLI